ncbi:putative quinol monooxygenase [Kineococcus aurantiacus]|uniref:Quinol monooxygenase YgiN n=1 Tax=Kineococcus aurantiacus TaxID=37633 RepID=A0A7Y9DIN8_9ACTN|nr:putative quinol monooxygenase [Kineococcus aurantiacus]NYD21760.1 quinol monooxygenase YgiN [Kineococcus aurantiacus]
MSTPTAPGGPDGTNTYVLVVVLRARPGRAGQVLTRLHELAEVSLAEPGCLQYRVHRDVDDPATFALYEEWQDEAAWQRHDTGAQVVELLEALTPDLADPIAVRRLLPS